MKAVVVVLMILSYQNFTGQNINQIINESNIDYYVPIKNNPRDLIGIWEIRKLLMDYGDRIEQITFSSFGEISYNPKVEVENSETFIGKYEVTSDSIKIKFFKKTIFEYYRYKIANDSLFLFKIESYAPYDYMINNEEREKVFRRVY